MTEVKYFCKPVSKFDISELDLSKEELKYATMAYKSPRYLVNVVREFCGLEALTRRIYGILEREDRGRGKKYNRSKAQKISERIYDKIDKAGYIRSRDDFRSEKADLFSEILTHCENWIPFDDPVSFLKNELGKTGIRGGWNWSKKSEGLRSRCEVLHRLEKYLWYPRGLWRLHHKNLNSYETYDPEKMEDAVTKVMCKFLSPKQREMISWVVESKNVIRFYTEEEFNLYKAAMCAIIANIYEIEAIMLNKALFL